jgi:transcriptional regulator with XRE-family HTH domain
MLDRISDWISARGPVPNKLTLAMGELIRQAREEIGMSQADLAKRIYRNQAALSQIENGKMRIDAETLLHLAVALDKPIREFFPDRLMPRFEGELTVLEAELLKYAHQLELYDLQKLVVQAKALVELAEAQKQQIRETVRQQFEEFEQELASEPD